MRFKQFFALLIVLGTLCVYAVETEYHEDSSAQRALHVKDPRSHIKIFLPAMPYVSVARLINEGLVRLADNEQGWEYSLATQCLKKTPLLYECDLRQGVKFQDGTAFNADAVINNFHYFMAQPINYTDINHRLKGVEKLSDYKIKIELYKPYGMLFRDLARINFYTEAYLKKFAWRGAATGPNIEEAGPYGLGPYVLVEGVITGRKQTPKVILKANPYYWEKGFPKIETITLYTQLETDKALKMMTEHEGELDFMPIPFNKKIETMLSAYSKLVILPSTNNFALYFNLIKKDSPVYDKKVRQALNCALNQYNLLTFTYKQEGSLNREALRVNECPLNHEEISEALNNKHFKIVTQDSLLFLWKGIEYQLSQYNVTLHYTITSDEKMVYDFLLSNNETVQDWDILSQNTIDWYGRHPWLIFFNYQEGNPWSFVRGDKIMQSYISDFFGLEQNTPEFNVLCEKIRQRAKEEAYMLFVPTPNNVFAMNKELVFEPLGIGMQPFWKANITDQHWSIRGDKPYPKELQVPIFPKRLP
ncbi:putative periplasmic binding protein [Sulfurospirillum diekertiae]|uniref:ABC transporter substrate-binding protein n=1 Tax=Sulfurospirillum diekertiae TaxID=1854492 RepID=A0A290HLI0_9BACT|nr:ABC transporter substrate-binding protein [Sulfurospirillum diekertiae]ATB68578.1 putative periplasmic binding protein [Sulfurospirillum diekertiae]QIR76419.1 ABC transporter substrate-binding protein [Sulfurospirillum diekertiae]